MRDALSAPGVLVLMTKAREWEKKKGKNEIIASRKSRWRSRVVPIRSGNEIANCAKGPDTANVLL